MYKTKYQVSLRIKPHSYSMCKYEPDTIDLDFIADEEETKELLAIVNKRITKMRAEL